MVKDELTKIPLVKLDEKYPLVPHTNAGRLFSLVRRMKAEKKLKIPIGLRTSFGISVETSKAANKITEQEWEKFYQNLCEQLKKDYLELYNRLFSTKEKR